MPHPGRNNLTELPPLLEDPDFQESCGAQPPASAPGQEAFLADLHEGADDTAHREQSAQAAAEQYGLELEEARKLYGLPPTAPVLVVALPPSQ